MASPKRDEMILLAHRLISEKGYHAWGFHQGSKSRVNAGDYLSQCNLTVL